MKAIVLTVSDGCYHGQRPDRSGQALTESAPGSGMGGDGQPHRPG